MLMLLVYHDQMSSWVLRNKYRYLVSHVACELEFQFTVSVPSFLATIPLCLCHVCAMSIFDIVEVTVVAMNML